MAEFSSVKTCRTIKLVSRQKLGPGLGNGRPKNGSQQKYSKHPQGKDAGEMDFGVLETHGKGLDQSQRFLGRNRSKYFNNESE
ncbi:MAG: hypothetical protein HOK91_03685 [Gammaproteobacteria bacterium]|jgi:hypothetical protein|nr:hypothetical protein [Gammaproteobacteria bacterium]